MIPDEADFSLSSYRFDLPPEQIAQFPPEERGASRLLVLPRKGASDPRPELRHGMFGDLPDCLPENALIIANNSRVLQARLLGSRGTGGKVEFLLLTPLPLVMERARPDKRLGGAGGAEAFSAEAEGLVRCGGSVREGETFAFGAGISVTVLESGPFGQRRVRLAWQGDLAKAFAATAGLHFTPAMREKLADRGFEWAEVTLYVGYGTFSPVRCEDIRSHRMHREYVEVPEATAAAIARAKAQGRPVVAVGTTSVRTLEGVAELCGRVQPYTGWTDIFLYPGRSFRVVDAVLTNFHLPESSLLMLVSAFAGRERMLAAYAEAVTRGYRFFSYGDAMLIK